MTDFTLRPAARTPGSGLDFRLYPGWSGAGGADVVSVDQASLAPAAVASGEIAISWVVAVSGVSRASAAIALGAVAIHRFIAVTARAPWADTASMPVQFRATLAGLNRAQRLSRASWANPGSMPVLFRAAWPGLPQLERFARSPWTNPVAAPATPIRAKWPNLIRLERLVRARRGSIEAGPSAPVRAPWRDLVTPLRSARTRWESTERAPSAPVRATWRDLVTPWVRYRLRWGRLISPPHVWPRRDPPIVHPPPVVVPVADVFRLYLRDLSAVHDFRLRLGGPYLVTTRTTYRMIHTFELYRLSDNLPLVADSLNVQSDRDSYGWNFSLSTRDAATVDALFDSSYPPAVLVAVVDGHAWHLQPTRWQDARQFGKTRYTVSGASRTAVLDSPYSEATSGEHVYPITARQAAESALQGTGFSLQWQLPTDWTVANRQADWADATPLKRVAAIVAAIGGTLQSATTGATLIAAPRLPFASWELSGQTPDVVLSGALLLDAQRVMAEPSPYDCVYVGGTEAGYLVKVTRIGTQGERPAPMVADPLLTEILACRERGRQILGAAANKKTLSVQTVLAPLGQAPGVLAPGTVVEIVIDGSHWLDVVMRCEIDVEFGKVRQRLGFGEAASNSYARLRRLLPTDPLLTGTVIAHWPDDTSTVELPGGGTLRVRGTDVAVGARAFVQGGRIQSEAPALPGASVDV